MSRPAAGVPGRAVPYILAACTAVSVLSTDLITPSIPDLPDALDTGISVAQMTVGVNLAAYALAQLVHGPVADALGRKRLLSVAFAAFAIFSVLCALATSIEWLLAGRFLQGLSSSVPSVVIILIIRELYGPSQALRVMAIYGATLGVAPALGPLIGGYLHVWFGWRAGFLFIAVVALAVLALFRWQVPESLDTAKPLRLGGAVGDYLGLLQTPSYMVPLLGISLLFGAYYAYITTAPVVFISLLGLPTQHYGLTHLVTISAFIMGNLLTSRLSRHLTGTDTLRLAAGGMVLAVVLLTLPVFAGIVTVPLILGGMAVYAMCLALVLAAGPLVVLNAAGRAPQGPASALLGSAQLGLASLGGFLSAHFYDGTALPMVVTMALMILLGAALVFRSCQREPEGGISPAAPESGRGD